MLTVLAGCAVAPPVAPKSVVDCPVSVAVPAPLVGQPTAARISALEIRVALWGEAERKRGDCWMAAAGER